MARLLCSLLFLFSILGINPPAGVCDVLAVAAGIAPCVEEVVEAYIAQGGEAIGMVKGSCGVLARQMASGAPYDLLLASEPRWPNWLKGKGGILDLKIFARGQVVLWHEKSDPPKLLSLGKYLLSIPEPETTAYGMLAKEYLQRRGLWDYLIESKKIIFVGNAPQAVLAVRNGALDAAFIPRSMAIKAGGSYINIDRAVIDQVGGLAVGAGENARRFWLFCRSADVQAIWRKWGFEAVITK
ncbi:MAG: molybdate ABC transporter substrate-binding protein [Spirochaeta sp.]|nr:molybdate ABC transporter substrate-binding protein [Spirochaeta sp.]